MIDRRSTRWGFVLGVASLILLGGRRLASRPGGTETVWRSSGWRVEGSAIHLEKYRVVVERARARSRTFDWEVVASRWVGIRDPADPRRLVAWRARGDVRAVDGESGYLSGRGAVSFRPRRSFVVTSDASVDWLGPGWRMPAERVVVQLSGSRIAALGIGGSAADR